MFINEGTNSLRNTIIRWVGIPERIYLLVALIGTVGFAVITPPFHGPDEEAHYVRVQYIAHGHILPIDPDTTNASLPESIQITAQKTFYDVDLPGRTSEKYDVNLIEREIKVPLNEKEVYKPPMISYTALAYLPAVPGVIIANAFDASPVLSMYVARISLALASVLIIYFAIKILPAKKYLFTTIALVPMLLFQQAMVSIDGISYALLLLFICIVLYFYKRGNLTKGNWISIGGLSLFIVLAKPLVFLFLPVILLLSKEKNALRWITGIAICCVIVLSSISFYNAHNADKVITPETPAGANSSVQMANLVENPKRFFRVMWNTYMTEYGDEKLRGVIGIFGSADTKYVLWAMVLYIMLFTLVAFVQFSKTDNIHISKYVKIAILILCALYFALVNLAIYLSFSPVNFDIIYGVQGRYFIPIILVVPLLITPFLRVRNDQRRVELKVAVALLFLTLVALFITFQRYYLFTP